MKKLLFVFLILLTLLRMVLVAIEPPSPDEAYYFLCAQRLDWGYFDGPPGIALLVRAALELSGGAFTVAREMMPVFSLAAAVAIFALVRAIYSESIACWTVVTLNLIPLINIFSTRLNPFVPALLAVTIGLCFAWMAWDRDRSRTLSWVLAGVFFGIACVFRFDAFLPFLGVIVAALSSPRHRRSADISGIVMACGLIAAGLAAPLYWNFRQDWLPIASGTLQTAWILHPAAFFFALDTFFVALSPLIGGALLIALFVAGSQGRQHIRARFLFAAAVAPAIWWLYMAMRGFGDPAPILFVAPPLVAWLFSQSEKLEKGAAALTGMAWIVSIFLTGTALIQGVGQDRIWSELASRLTEDKARVATAIGGEPFLVAQDVPMASALGLQMMKPGSKPSFAPPVFIRESQDISNQFALWPSYADFSVGTKSDNEYYTEEHGTNPYTGRSALYVSDEAPGYLPQTIAGAFENVSLLRKLDVAVGGAAPRTFYFYLCRNYQTMPL